MATRSKSAASKAETPPINRKALVVAIDDYPETRNDLTSCVADAKAMAALLQATPYKFEEIQTYTNEQATVANVKAGMEWLFSNAASDRDRLVLFFSGHGFRTERGGVLRECLCLHDGLLFDDELVQLTQMLPPGILSILLDCCHSGGMAKNFVLEDGRIKTFFPTDQQELNKAFAPRLTPLPVKPFGCATLPNPGEFATKAFMAAEPQVNGLIITACQADQVALAGSAKTEGKSAFTYGLLEAIRAFGATAEVSNRQLFDQTSAILKSLQFKQIPVLHEPTNALGLQDKSFITLQSTSVLECGKTPASSASPIESSKINPKGAPIMPAVQPPALNLNRSLTEADAQFCTEVIKCSLQVAPMMLQAVNPQNLKSNGQNSNGNSKFWGALIPGVIGVIPTIVDAIRGKNWQTESDAPISEEKFWTQVISAALGVIPSIIDVATKGATDSKDLSLPLTEADAQFCTEVIKCSLQIMPTMLEPDNLQNLSNGQPTSGNSKFWGVLIPSVLSVIPSIVDAISGKDWQTDSDAPIAEEKFWTQVISAALGVIPSIIDAATKGAADSKDFAPRESSAVSPPAPTSNGGVSTDVADELVDAVMTRLASTLLAAR
ncbi:caspase family protein [Cyanobacteria bacterium FACHB-63]|nr:caspase family protein [Cyanobacteria bacterium FACHB-63]